MGHGPKQDHHRFGKLDPVGSRQRLTSQWHSDKGPRGVTALQQVLQVFERLKASPGRYSKV